MIDETLLWRAEQLRKAGKYAEAVQALLEDMGFKGFAETVLGARQRALAAVVSGTKSAGAVAGLVDALDETIVGLKAETSSWGKSLWFEAFPEEDHRWDRLHAAGRAANAEAATFYAEQAQKSVAEARYAQAWQRAVKTAEAERFRAWYFGSKRSRPQ